MYAIIRTGGKQYRVQPGDVIRVEKLEQKLGSKFDVTDVLLVGGDSPVLGQPVVKNALVTVIVTKQTRDRKVIVFKKKRRQGYRRFKTHRQHFTELFVQSISLDGKVTKADQEAKVVDVDQVRQARIATRSEKVEKTPGGKLEAVAKKAAAKAAKVPAAKKSPAGKKAGAAKKKTVAKKKTAK